SCKDSRLSRCDSHSLSISLFHEPLGSGLESHEQRSSLYELVCPFIPPWPRCPSLLYRRDSPMYGAPRVRRHGHERGTSAPTRNVELDQPNGQSNRFWIHRSRSERLELDRACELRARRHADRVCEWRSAVDDDARHDCALRWRALPHSDLA